MHGRSITHVMRRAIAHFALLLVLVLPASVLAQTYTHSALIDSDNDAMTGCTVTTAAGTVSGVELRVTASVSAIPPQVDSVTREVCSGGVLGAPVAIGGGYPVALNTGTGGADGIEMAFPVTALPGAGTDDWQVAYQSQSALGADQMGPVTAVGIGTQPAAVQIPALSPAGLIVLSILMGLLLLWGARRHRGLLSVLMLCGSLSFFGLAWAATFIADGDLSDWVGVSPVATDPTGDSTSGQDNIDLVAGFIARESNQIFVRVDVVDAEVHNIAPVIAAQSFSLDENSANATSVGTVVASDADVGDVLTYAITAGNGSGTFAIDANTGAITVADNTALDFETTPSFPLTVSVTDNGIPNLTSSAIVTINVNDLNEAPSIADQSFNILEDSANGTVVGTAAGTDPDGTAPNNTLSYAITAGNTGGAFAIDGNGQITVATSAAIIVANAPFNLTVTVTDGGTPNLSATAAVTVSVTHVNHEPSFTPGADVNANEDAGAQSVAGWATAIDDGDGNTQVLTFNITGNTNAALFSTPPAVDPLTGNLTFTSAPDANGSASITLELMDDGGTASGGNDTSPPATFTINVAAVNDAPSFNAGAVQTALEDSGTHSVPGWVTAISPGPADESGQSVTFNVSNDNNPMFSVQPAVAANGTLAYTLAANAFGTANISVTAMDDGGTANGGVDTSAAQVVAINVTGINDAPSFTSGGDTNSNEDAGAQTVAGWASAISDGDANTQTLTFNVTNNTNPGLFSTAPAVNAINGNLTYTAAPNANGSATITLTLSDDGGTANGGVDSSAPVMFTITINPVNDPPTVANAPSFAVQSNIGISQPDDPTVDLLGSARGIADIDSAGPYTVGTVGTGMATTAGGVIDIAADGSFSYDPPLNATGADTFVYTVCDAGTPMPPACTPVTLTLNISGPSIVFVDDSASGTGATGTLRHPLTSVPAGLTALSSGAGSTDLFVFSGSYPLPTIQSLANNVRIVGQAATAASFDALYGITPPALSDARPALSQPSPTLTGTGACLGLGQNNTLRGLTIGNCNGAAIAGNGFATLTVNDNVVINNGLGAALSLTNGTAAATFASVSAAGGSPDVSLTTLAGSLNLGGGSLSGAAGGLRVNASTANIDYSGSMSITGGRAVDIQNATAGTINLGGAITHNSGSPQGIFLNSNAGATINFTNTLNLSTGANPAFTATGGGTVTATGGAASTLTTTTGLAVNVINTNIGAGGLNFRSISSNGGANGIILNNTGAIASLVVTGTGTTAGSGGTIRNKTGDGITLLSTQGVSLSNMNLTSTAIVGSPSATCGTNLQGNTTCTAAIDMQAVSNVTLNGLNISGNQQYGINGNGVADFSMTGTTISNSGNESEEDGVRFINLTGNNLIRNSTIQDSYNNNLRIYNTVSTPLNLTIDATVAGASRFLRSFDNDGILMEGLNSADMTLNVSGTNFDSSNGDHIQTAIDDTATMNVTIANNTMTATNPAVLGSGITLSSSADFSGTMTYSITGNTINGSNAKSINVNLGTTTAGTGSYTGTISGNAIGTSGVAQSGGAGMDVVANGNGTLNAIVTNNTIRQFDSDHGLRILHRDGAGRINATVTNNTVTQPEPGGFNGVVVQAGASSTLPDSGTICLDINGNTMAGSGAGGGSATDFRMRQRFSTTIELRGYTGASTDTAAVVTYVQGINPGAETGSATADGTPGGGFVNTPGGAACN